VILNANLACLNDRPLDRDLAAALARPVRLANDGKCFVLSEAIDGAAAPPADLDRARPDVVFGATLGTGVGGGIVVDGRVLTGENGAATEWSHTTLPFLREGEHAPYVCVCGHADCIESFTSGRALAAWHAALGGGDVDGNEIGRRAAAGDLAAGQAFAAYEHALARALASVVNMLDPRAIVLGGGVSNNERIFRNVPALWERWTVPKDLRTRLVPAAHGDASGVRGAAFLWPLGA
jgi:fructokinase